MQRKKYVSRFSVLLCLIIEYANVNALSLTSCDNPLENEVCNLTCTTTDHEQNVVFDKEPNTAIIAQCITGVGCFGTSQYSISQPNTMSTILSFIHSRNNAGTWRCSYGATPTPVSVPWATYPQTVSTTLTSNTIVDTNIDGNVTLGCLYSEEAPTVTLQYENANGNNDAMSTETFQCNATGIPCTDVDFTTYECPVVVKEETGIHNTDTYSIKVKIKVSHVQTEDVHTIVTDITFKHPTTSVSSPSPVSTDIMNYETISTVSVNITEALTITSDVSLSTYKATRILTESVNTVIYDSSVVINTEFYTIHSLSTTGVETHVPQSSFISSDLYTSMQASLLTTNSSVSMDLMSNNTAVTVSDKTAGSFESASTTAGILTTAFDSATSNIGSINSLITHSSIVATPLFSTTDKLPVTEVETSLLRSDIISSDSVTSMQASLIAKNSSVSMDLMNNNTADTVGDTTAASTEGASTTTSILTTVFNSATSNTASIDSLIIHSSIVTTPLFYTTDKLSATNVETVQMPSGIISSDFVISVAASSFAENSSVPTDFMNNKTVMIVSSTTIESFEGVSTTDDILTSEYDATNSNTVSINSVLSLNYTVTTPLFYTTDLLPATEVETPVLQPSFISADTGTSMPSLNIDEESKASTDIISIETVVTVSDTTSVSFVATPADILSTSFDFTLELSRTFQSTNVPVMTSIETNDIHLDTNSYISSSVLFYLSTDIPGISSESDYAINVTSVNTYIPSMVMVVSASTDTSSLTPSNLSIMGSQTTMNTTEAMTLSSNMLSITSLSPSFVLQSSVFSQSTVRLQSILDPSSFDLISSNVQNLLSVSSSISTHPTIPNGNSEKATSQIQSAFSSPELISSSVQYLQSVTSTIDTYLTTPNGNNEQVTTPIQSAFSENFIIISASVVGVIIIVFVSLMVLYWLNKLPGQQRHKSNELHKDKPDNISLSSFSPNNYMHNESYSGPVYQYSNIPLRLTPRYNLPHSYNHHIHYENNWNNI